jgi:hypothetical protein
MRKTLRVKSARQSSWLLQTQNDSRNTTNARECNLDSRCVCFVGLKSRNTKKARLPRGLGKRQSSVFDLSWSGNRTLMNAVPLCNRVRAALA